MQQEFGSLLLLYTDDLESELPVKAHEFLLKKAAESIENSGGRNWLPVIVKQIALEKYQVIANQFIFAAAEEAGLERLWCLVVEDSPEIIEATQILTQERIPRVNLTYATYDEISVALDYFKVRHRGKLTNFNVTKAVSRIYEAPRQFWKESLTEVIDLKCGITKGIKLNLFKEIFYVTPEPLPSTITDPKILSIFKKEELKEMAKKRGLKKYSNLNKDALINLLSQDSGTSS